MEPADPAVIPGEMQEGKIETRSLQAKAERIAREQQEKVENTQQQLREITGTTTATTRTQSKIRIRALTTLKNRGSNQTGVASKCNHYGICHLGQCPPKCYNCGKMGHKEKECGSKNVASGTNARSAVVCYECGERSHKSQCKPKKLIDKGNVRGQAL
ncbi:putative reverse transcriptase domain-containing protein [Tanacetum coccineum]